MESYSITCTTCRAHLRVRGREAVGQILACPKCGSMVLVQPPPGAASSDPTAPAAATAGSAAPTDATSPPLVTPTSDSVKRPARSTRFRDDFSLPAPIAGQRSGSDLAAGFAVTGPPKVGTHAVAAPPAFDDPPGPLENVDSPPPRWHRVGWLVGAAAAGVVLAVLAVGWLAGRRASDSPAVATPAEPQAVPAAAAGQTPPADARGTANPTTAPEARADGPVGASDAVEPSSDSQPLPGSPPPDPAPSMAMAEAAQPTPPADRAPDEAPLTDLEPAAPPAVQVAVEAPAAVPALDIPLAAIDLQGMPLVDFADFVADFTGLPVSLDLTAMAVAQIAPSTPLTCQREEVTMDALLHDVLAGIDMQPVLGDQQIVFAPASVPETPWEAAYEVADLAHSKQDLQALGELVMALVAPASWASAGGTATLTTTETSLRIQQQASAHFQIAQLLDRLRAARGLPPQNQQSAGTLDPTPAMVEATRALGALVSCNCPSPSTVSRVLADLRAQTELHLVVDWRATAAAAWLPATDTALSCADRPLAEVLEAWLGPYGLGFRVHDAQTVQITTRDALAQCREVAVYPLELAAGEDATTVLDQLRATLQELGTPAATTAQAIRLDAPSRSLLVSLPQPQQRTLAARLAATGRLRAPGPAPAGNGS